MRQVTTPISVSDRLLAIENGLHTQQDKQSDDENLFADLTGIYVEIIREIAKTDKEKSLIIYDYAKLLQEEIQLYSGTEAYIMGCESSDVPASVVLQNYHLKIADRQNTLDMRIQTSFNEIALLLGDCRGLVSDFTEVYRQIHGAIKNNIAEFIVFGQCVA